MKKYQSIFEPIDDLGRWLGKGTLDEKRRYSPEHVTVSVVSVWGTDAKVWGVGQDGDSPR